MSREAFSLLHPGVQEAVWQLGWKEFKHIQAESIRAVCQTDHHLVICAQTAGGKTEAAFLPVISRLAQAPQPSIQAIYVGPLKALINDQFRRLEELCAKLDLPVHRWHGDVSASEKKHLRAKPGGILLITPESLESNFINFGAQVPRLYRHLEFIVIDELHSFLSNVRGVHLQSLLSRLRAAANCAPRLMGLSATLAQPLAARAFLAPDAPETVQLIEDTSARREIKFSIKTFLAKPLSHRESSQRLSPPEALALAEQLAGDQPAPPLAPSASPTASAPAAAEKDELDEIAADVSMHFANSTNLIFGNSKQTIEVLADRLHQLVRKERWPADPFLVHHGSLSKDLREETEVTLKSGQPTTALCSSTLEMGIDIGHVQAVGQLDAPWSVSSMVQRLGRSGRRRGEPSIMRLYVRCESPQKDATPTDLLYPDLLRGIAMTRLMLAKWLEPFEQAQMHLSTLVHQILSCLKQTGGLRAPELFRTLCALGPFRQVNQKQFAQLLRGLAEHELVQQMPQGEIILALAGERLTSNFDFYAAFQSTEEFSVRCGEEEIGKLPANIVPPAKEHLILGGRRWLVEEVLTAQKLVLVTFSPGGKAPSFQGAGGEIHSRVMREMKGVLLGDDVPSYLDENSKLLLRAARRVATALRLAERDIVVGKQTLQWFPWVGTRARLTLSLLAKAAGIAHEVDRISIHYRLTSLEAFRAHLQNIIALPPDRVALARLLAVKAHEKFDGFIPESLLDEANVRRCLAWEEACAACEACLSAIGAEKQRLAAPSQ